MWFVGCVNSQEAGSRNLFDNPCMGAEIPHELEECVHVYGACSRSPLALADFLRVLNVVAVVVEC